MNSMSTRLDECCQIELSSIDKKSKENEKEVYLCNFTDVYYNWNIYSSMKNTFMKATASDNNISIFSLKAGDVVITKDSETRDDIGIPAYIYDDLNNTVLGYHCALIRPTKKILGSYLNAYLSSYLGRKHFSNQASGSGQRYTLTKESLGSISIPLIDKKQQMFIGSLFNNIDKKISLNNKIISELESMAKTIYDYWFLQFEFPNEEGKPYKSSGGKMVWNEELKREIPEGWKITRVDDIVKQAPKIKSIKAPDYLETGQYPIVDQAETLITGYTNDSSLVYKNDNGCVVFGDVTTYFKYINFSFAKGTDGTKILESKNNRIPSLLLFFLVKDAKLPNIGFARHYMYLRDFKFLLPPLNICDLFNRKTKSSMGYRAKLISQNQELTSLRDFLLPLLMNGQVGFKEVTE